MLFYIQTSGDVHNGYAIGQSIFLNRLLVNRRQESKDQAL